MSFEEFKKVLLNHPPDIWQKMYNYGYTCGLENVINYDDIKAAFHNFNVSEEDEIIYLKKIIKGFRDGKFSKIT